MPQPSSIPGSNQVLNRTGGYTWAVDGWMRLERFLILVSEGRTISNCFSIADPNDAGMLDVVGFDTAIPEVIRAFS